MKTVVLILFATALSAFSCAQNIHQANVPALVLNSFQQQFPKAGDVEWKRKGGLYEVEFETGLAGTDHTMLLDSLGRVTYHKTDITEAELPAVVKNSISAQFPGFRMDDLEKIESNGTVTYKADLKKKPEEWEAVFSKDGVLLSKVAD